LFKLAGTMAEPGDPSGSPSFLQSERRCRLRRDPGVGPGPLPGFAVYRPPPGSRSRAAASVRLRLVPAKRLTEAMNAAAAQGEHGHIGIENLSDGINGEVNLLCLELGSHLGDGCSININEANGRFFGNTVGCDNPREDTEKKRANRFSNVPCGSVR